MQSQKMQRSGEVDEYEAQNEWIGKMKTVGEICVTCYLNQIKSVWSWTVDQFVQYRR